MRFPTSNYMKSAGGVTYQSLAAGYEAESLTLFAAMTTAPTTQRKSDIDTFIKALKTAGIWTKFDLFYVLAAADAQAASLNWVSPSTFALTATGGGTGFTVDRGYGFSAASGNHVDSTYDPFTNGVQYQLNSAHIAVWDRVSAQVSGALIGFATDGSHVYSRYVDDQCYSRVNGGSVSVTNTDASGLSIGTRTGASAVAVYHQALSATDTDASVSFSAGTAFRFGNMGGGLGLTDHQVALASVGAGLNSTEAAAYRSAAQAYMTAVGA